MRRYQTSLTFCAGIVMGFWNAMQMEGELVLWMGAVIAAVTLVCIWIVLFIFTGLKKDGS